MITIVFIGKCNNPSTYLNPATPDSKSARGKEKKRKSF